MLLLLLIKLLSILLILICKLFSDCNLFILTVIFMKILFFILLLVMLILIFVIMFGLIVLLVLIFSFRLSSSKVFCRVFLSISLKLFSMILVLLIFLIICSMKKNDSVLRSSASLFATPVSYPVSEPRKTILVVLEKDDKGKSVIVNKCIEDEMSKQIALDYKETCLQNLVDKGVDPHGLDMVDTQRLGVDAGIDDLAQILISNSQRFVNLPKTAESSSELKN